MKDLSKQTTPNHHIETNNHSESTNNIIDRTYDHFYNTYKRNLYDYLIENIPKAGKRYKMIEPVIKK